MALVENNSIPEGMASSSPRLDQDSKYRFSILFFDKSCMSNSNAPPATSTMPKICMISIKGYSHVD